METPRLSSESICKRLEKMAVDNDCWIVRCDHGRPKGQATTQVVSPYHTRYFNETDSRVFIIQIDLSKDFKKGLEWDREERSENRNNTGPRFRVWNMFSSPEEEVSNLQIFDPKISFYLELNNKMCIFNFHTLKLMNQHEISSNFSSTGREVYNILTFPEKKIVLRVQIQTPESYFSTFQFWDIPKSRSVIHENLKCRIECIGKNGTVFGITESEILIFQDFNFESPKEFVLGQNKFSNFQKLVVGKDENLVFCQCVDPRDKSIVIVNWDLRMKESPVRVFHPISNCIRFLRFNESSEKLFYFSLSKKNDDWSLFCEQDELINEFRIRDFIPFSTSRKIIAINSERKFCIIPFSSRKESFVFGDDQKDKILFNGLDVCIVSSQREVLIYKFRRNEVKINLGCILKDK